MKRLIGQEIFGESAVLYLTTMGTVVEKKPAKKLAYNRHLYINRFYTYKGLPVHQWPPILLLLGQEWLL